MFPRSGARAFLRGERDQVDELHRTSAEIRSLSCSERCDEVSESQCKVAETSSWLGPSASACRGCSLVAMFPAVCFELFLRRPFGECPFWILLLYWRLPALGVCLVSWFPRTFPVAMISPCAFDLSNIQARDSVSWTGIAWSRVAGLSTFLMLTVFPIISASSSDGAHKQVCSLEFFCGMRPHCEHAPYFVYVWVLLGHT